LNKLSQDMWSCLDEAQLESTNQKEKMIRRLISFASLIFLLLAVNAIGGLASSEKMAWSTYAVATSKGLGTGVIVNCRDSNARGGGSPVLVTCAHVLQSAPRGPYFLVVRSPVAGSNPDIAILRIDIPRDCEHPFIKHPRYDVAAMRIDLPPEIARLIKLSSFLDERTIGRQGAAHVGDEIFILGFPKIFPGTTGGFPVFRSGRIASYSPGSQLDRVRFLVHSDIYSGDSGGPVFAEHNWGGPKLLGLITERVGGKNRQVPLAIAVDVSAVRETLAQLHASESPHQIQSSGRLPAAAANA